MILDEQTVAYLQYFLDTANGAALMFLLSGVAATKRNLRSMALVAALCFGAVAVAIGARGLEGFSLVYALCVHLPFLLFFVFRLRCPPVTALFAHILAYFMGAPRFVLGYVAILLARRFNLPLDEPAAMRLGWAISGPLLFWPIRRFLVPPLRGLISCSSSERPYLLAILGSCYVFTQAIFATTSGDLWPQLFLLFLVAFLASLVGYSRKLQELRGSNERMVAYSVKNEALALYAESLAGYLRDTARLRHDHRHFLALLDLYAARGDLPGIRRLIGDDLAALDARPELLTGNSAVDAIVALFRGKAGESGVSIEMSGRELRSLPLPENDLCFLLSNGLENAIEAARLAPAGGRSVALSVSRNAESGSVSLSLRNPCTQAVAFARDGVPSSARGPGHGYGTSSMRTIVEKNGGVCGFFVEGGEFVFRATFLPGKAAG